MAEPANFQIDRSSARLEALMATEQRKDLLRFLVCGSVDDGKSTLIGRLLYDSKLIYEDQLAGLAADSKRIGTTGGDLDLALLLDGLQAEREQGITIDVAYRYFATAKRKFIVADTPGHEQYTRNMATGASNCGFAVLLVNARQGLAVQTRRHATIASLLGIRKVALAINKMDLIDYQHDRFDRIATEFAEFAKELDFEHVVAIPISALLGDNLLVPSQHMHWYHGPTLMGLLETVDVASRQAEQPFRLPVQMVTRPNQDFRGFAGTIATGRVRPGDDVIALPSHQRTQVRRIVTYDGDLNEARAGDAVTLTLADEIDVSRGSVIAHPDFTPDTSDQISADVIWMSSEPMLPGRSYLLKLGAQLVSATISSLKYKLNVNTQEHQASRTLALNEIGNCNISCGRSLVFDRYRDSRDLGGFILIDRFTNATVGAGMIAFGLRRATNIRWQELDIDKQARAGIKSQRPCVLWFTGLSGAGKSTIANLLEKRLHANGHHTYLLDGDNVRHGLNKDLGFTDADRVENVRRVAEVAKLFVDAGLIVMACLISPFRAERRAVRDMFAEGEFIEVFVDTPLTICERRDPKGLYRKARAGLITNFTGIDSAYEPPESPDIHLTADEDAPDKLVQAVFDELERRHVFGFKAAGASTSDQGA